MINALLEFKIEPYHFYDEVVSKHEEKKELETNTKDKKVTRSNTESTLLPIQL